MILEGYGAFNDSYAYPGSTVLKNKLDIQDQETLDAFEVEITTLRAEEPLPQGEFDSSHYRSVHRHLFQDVYEWAGEYRIVRISKGDSTFCYPEHIAAQMDALFDKLRGGEIFAEQSRSGFIEKIAWFLSELNAIHPFREGNGRTQLSFIGQVGATFDHPFHFAKLDHKNLLAAMITSYSGNLQPLIEELTALLTV